MKDWRDLEKEGAHYHDVGDAAGAARAYWQAMMNDKYLRSQREHLSNYLFCIHYLDGISDDDMYVQMLLAEKLYVYPSTLSSPLHERDSHIKHLRIGFLAPSFEESSSYGFYMPLITGLSKKGMQVFCYSMKSCSFIDIPTSISKISLADMDLTAAAENIRNDNLDVLIDLGGHSAGGMTLQIASLRPAPLQISAIGWFDTTAVPAIDLVLADKELLPNAEALSDDGTISKDCHFTEKLLMLPHAFCYMPREELLVASEPLTVCPEDPASSRVIFGSMQNYMKLNDSVLSLWLKLLEQMPSSQLVLQDTMTGRTTFLSDRLQRLGFPMNRLKLLDGAYHYLSNYHNIDIVLDTFPYTGGASTAEALIMGVPVITLAGSRYGARFSASILKSAGLPELIAHNTDEYISKAMTLAKDTSKLSRYHRTLRAHVLQSSLTDMDTYCSSFLSGISKAMTYFK